MTMRRENRRRHIDFPVSAGYPRSGVLFTRSFFEGKCMSAKNWRAVTRHVKVAFAFGCDGTASMRGKTWDLKCRNAGYAHGHAELADDEDGTCWLPFPVASQEGLRTFLARCCLAFSDEEKAAILALDEVLAL